MPLFNHEVSDEAAKWCQAFVNEFRKLFMLAEDHRCGLRQIGSMVSNEVYNREADVQRSIIKQLALGLCNEHIEFTGKFAETGGNMVGWQLRQVFGQDVFKVSGFGNNANPGYYIFIPDELVDNEEFIKELIAPKPAGFQPGLSIYESRGIRHLATCEENEICLNCGRTGFPYCNVHDYQGEYWKKTLLIDRVK